MNYIPYYRVSTKRQGRSGLGLDAQKTSVEEYVQRVNGSILVAFTEIESGRKCDRPQLTKAAALAKSQHSILIVAKLDRLARDAKFLLDLVDQGVQVVFCDLPDIATGDPITGRLVLTMMAAIAEFEARRISQRIEDAFAAKRARGEKMGWETRKDGVNPLTDEHRLAGSKIAREINLQRAKEFRESILPVAIDLQNQGMNNRQIAKAMNLAGYRTRRGKEWTIATVSQLLNNSN